MHAEATICEVCEYYEQCSVNDFCYPNTTMKLPKVKHDVLIAMDLVSRNNLGGSLSQTEIDELPNIVYVLYKEFSIHVNNKVKENLTSKPDK